MIIKLKYFDTQRSLKNLKGAVERRDVQRVVQLLQEAATTSNDPKVCCKALESLWDLSAEDDLRHYMLQNGIIDAVLDSMECFTSVSKIQVVGAGVICNLTFDPRQILPSSRSDRDFTSLFSMIGHTTLLLLKFIIFSPRNKQIISKYIWILWFIAHEEEGIEEILRHDGVEVILRILQNQVIASSNNVCQEAVKHATGFLWNMSDNTKASEIIVEKLGVEGLVSIMKRFFNQKVQLHITGIFTNLVCVLQSNKARQSLVTASVNALLDSASHEVVDRVLDTFNVMSLKWSRDTFVECIQKARIIPTLAYGMASASTIFSSTLLLKDIMSYDTSSGKLKKIFLRSESYGLPFLVETIAKLLASIQTSAIRELLKLIQDLLSMFPATCLSNPMKSASSFTFYSHLEPYNHELKARH